MSQEYHEALARYKRANPKVQHKDAVQYMKEHDWKTKAPVKYNMNKSSKRKSKRLSRVFGGDEKEELENEVRKAKNVMEAARETLRRNENVENRQAFSNAQQQWKQAVANLELYTANQSQANVEKAQRAVEEAQQNVQNASPDQTRAANMALRKAILNLELATDVLRRSQKAPLDAAVRTAQDQLTLADNSLRKSEVERKSAENEAAKAVTDQEKATAQSTQNLIQQQISDAQAAKTSAEAKLNEAKGLLRAYQERMFPILKEEEAKAVVEHKAAETAFNNPPAGTNPEDLIQLETIKNDAWDKVVRANKALEWLNYTGPVTTKSVAKSLEIIPVTKPSLRKGGVHMSNPKTQQEIGLMTDQFEKITKRAQEKSKAETTGVKTDADLLSQTAQVFQSRCDKNLIYLEEQIKKLQDQIEQSSSSSFELNTQIESLHKQVQQRADVHATRILVDVGLRWLEEKSEWVSPENLNKMNLEKVEPDLYYQYFLGLGKMMTKALTALAVKLRIDTANQPEPIQQPIYDAWNEIIKLALDSSGKEIRKDYTDPLVLPTIETIDSKFKSLLEISSTSTNGEVDVKYLQDAIDVLQLKSLITEEKTLEGQIIENENYFKKSIETLTALADRRDFPMEMPTLRLRGVKDHEIGIWNDTTSIFYTTRATKEKQLALEKDENTNRMQLMESLVRNIPRLMWVLYMQTDKSLEYVEYDESRTVNNSSSLPSTSQLSVETSTPPLDRRPSVQNLKERELVSSQSTFR